MSRTSQTFSSVHSKLYSVPSRLRRYQQARDLHFITFSCYRRQPKLETSAARTFFEHALEQTRRRYGFCVTGYVVMPEHVHLLLSEPETPSLATALQALKQSVSRTLALRSAEPFWQARYYDFNVYTEAKRVEKLRYMHRNPVVRGLVAKPEDWLWSSFRHYATDAVAAVGSPNSTGNQIRLQRAWVGEARLRRNDEESGSRLGLMQKTHQF